PVQALYANESLINSNSSARNAYSSAQLEASGYVKVANRDSFWFASLAMQKLSDFGAQVQAFLPLSAAAYQYLMREDVEAEVVEWGARRLEETAEAGAGAAESETEATKTEAGAAGAEAAVIEAATEAESETGAAVIEAAWGRRLSSVPPSVYHWYHNLTLCYSQQLADATALSDEGGSGAELFLDQ
ncbi:hypothetical protein B484DRAFT_410889, partial [Ochromonadaceae sp. CCMP2298]